MNRQGYQSYGEQGRGGQLYQQQQENQIPQYRSNNYYNNNPNYDNNRGGNAWRNGGGGGYRGRGGAYRSNNQQNYQQYDLKPIPAPESPARPVPARTPFRDISQNVGNSNSSGTPKKLVTFPSTVTAGGGSAGNSPVKKAQPTQALVPFSSPSAEDPVVFSAHLQSRLQPIASCQESEVRFHDPTPATVPPNSPMVEPVVVTTNENAYDVNSAYPTAVTTTTSYYPIQNGAYQTGYSTGGSYLYSQNAYPMTQYANYGPPYLTSPFGGQVGGGGGFFGPPPAYGPFYPQMMTPQYGQPLVCAKCGRAAVEQCDMACNTESIPSIG